MYQQKEMEMDEKKGFILLNGIARYISSFLVINYLSS
jgi:hypothetical protein